MRLRRREKGVTHKRTLEEALKFAESEMAKKIWY
jgi:hypothetical protein